MRTPLSLALLLALSVVACGTNSSTALAPDASVEGGTDASLADGALDAGTTGDADADAAIHGSGPLPDPSSASSYRMNPAHTRSVEDPTLAPPLVQAWTHDFGVDYAVGNPIIAGGRIYVTLFGETTLGFQLVALDNKTGAMSWEVALQDTTPLFDEPIGDERGG